MTDSEFLTLAEVGTGFKVMPNSSSKSNSGDSLGCLDVSSTVQDARKAGVHAGKSGLRNFNNAAAASLLIESVTNLASTHDAKVLSGALIKALDACARPKVHLIGLDFKISKNNGSHDAPGCDSGAVYQAAFIHHAPGESASKVVFFDINSFVAQQGAHVAYAIALHTLFGADPVGDAQRAGVMCSHLR